MSLAPDASFDDVLAGIAEVQGWMTRDQARRLWDRASVLRPDDTIVEIGSYHGRSVVVLATAAPDGVQVIAIDPHAGNDRGPQEIVGTGDEGQADNDQFNSNLERAGVRDRIRHVRKPSQGALHDIDGTVELLYIDGAHRYRPALDDIRRWGDRVARGGTMLIHDSFSSVGVTLALVVHCVVGSRFRYVGRVQSMAEYRREDLTGAERVRNALRQMAELPWFARNLAVKVLIVGRLRSLARFLGSDGSWPY